MGTDEEMLHEVDERDRIIGSCTRGDAHRLGLRHRSVHLLVFNERGELLLQKRSMNKDVHPGLWDSSAAGHVSFGESYEQCAVREVDEELGIALAQPPEFLFKLTACEQTGWEFVQVYRLVHAGAVRLNMAEIDEGRWFKPTELDHWLANGGEGLTPFFRSLWKIFRTA